MYAVGNVLSTRYSRNSCSSIQESSLSLISDVQTAAYMKQLNLWLNAEVAAAAAKQKRLAEEAELQVRRIAYEQKLQEMTDGDFHNFYILKEFIGGGGFGAVYKVKSKQAPLESLVCKFIKLKDFDENEVKIMMKLKGHDNIVQCHGCSIIGTYAKVILSSGGISFFDYLNDIRIEDEHRMRHLFRQMVSALQYIHSLNIAHLDIKPENMLINPYLNVTIIDFGLSKDLERTPGPFHGYIGTPEFGAIEMLQGQSSMCYPKPSDVWALGVTLFGSYFRFLPFGVSRDWEMYDDTPPFVKVQQQYSADFKDLLDGMLHVNQRKRLNINEVMNHSWTQGPNLTTTAVIQPTTQPLPVVIQPTTQQPPVVIQPTTQQPPVVIQPTIQQPPVVIQPTTQQPLVIIQPTTQQPPVVIQSTTQQLPVVIQPTTQQLSVDIQPTTQQPPVVIQSTTQQLPVVIQPTTQQLPVVIQSTSQQPPVVIQPTTQQLPAVNQPTTQKPPAVIQLTAQKPLAVIQPTIQQSPVVDHIAQQINHHQELSKPEKFVTCGVFGDVKMNKITDLSLQSVVCKMEMKSAQQRSKRNEIIVKIGPATSLINFEVMQDFVLYTSKISIPYSVVLQREDKMLYTIPLDVITLLKSFVGNYITFKPSVVSNHLPMIGDISQEVTTASKMDEVYEVITKPSLNEITQQQQLHETTLLLPERMKNSCTTDMISTDITEANSISLLGWNTHPDLSCHPQEFFPSFLDQPLIDIPTNIDEEMSDINNEATPSVLIVEKRKKRFARVRKGIRRTLAAIRSCWPF